MSSFMEIQEKENKKDRKLYKNDQTVAAILEWRKGVTDHIIVKRF